MKDRISLNIPKKSEFVSLARLTSAGIANYMKFTYEDIEDIRIAVAEAILNVFFFDKNSDSVDVEFIIDGTELKIKLKGFSKDAEKLLEANDEIALGVSIIESLMDKIEVFEEYVIITKKIGE